jgi:hypothetical protein
MARSSYDKFKEFRGKKYTGMAVGRTHTWRYDPGEWKERKVTPDRWEVRYAVKKHRKGRAPEGSGAPVGTAYHWYIVADQTVTKLDANSYMTELIGHKLKIAHKRADKSSWSASERTKRKQLVKLLRELADDLEAQPIEETAAAAADSAARPKRVAHTTRATHRPTTRTHRPRPARASRPAQRTPRSTARPAARRH